MDMRFGKGVYSLAIFLATVIAFTSAYDTIFSLDIGEFHIRFSTVVIIVFSVGCIAVFVLKNSLYISKPILLLTAVWLLQFIPVFESQILFRSIAYQVWLLVYLLLVIAASNIRLSSRSSILLVNIYVLSITAHGLVGIGQSVGCAVGIEGLSNFPCPRTTGLSYEPSYFVTQLVPGYGLLLWLLADQNLAKLIWKARLQLFLLISAIILSTSRLGIAFLVVATVVSMFIGSSSNRTAVRKFLATIGKVGLVCGIVVPLLMLSDKQIDVVFQGIPITKSSGDWSFSYRYETTLHTLAGIKYRPLFGYSFGGSPEGVAASQGIDIRNVKNPKDYTGMNVLAETILSCGIVGGILAVGVVVTCFTRGRKVMKVLGHGSESTLIGGMLFSLGMMIVMLQFNQNILRNVFWVHAAVLLCLVESYKTLALKERGDGVSSKRSGGG